MSSVANCRENRKHPHHLGTKPKGVLRLPPVLRKNLAAGFVPKRLRHQHVERKQAGQGKNLHRTICANGAQRHCGCGPWSAGGAGAERRPRSRVPLPLEPTEKGASIPAALHDSPPARAFVCETRRSLERDFGEGTGHIAASGEEEENWEKALKLSRARFLVLFFAAAHPRRFLGRGGLDWAPPFRRPQALSSRPPSDR